MYENFKYLNVVAQKEITNGVFLRLSSQRYP